MDENGRTREFIFDAHDIREDGVYERRYSVNGENTATLVLRPGPGAFIIQEDDIPFRIESGLADLCQCLHHMLVDWEYHSFKGITLLLQDLHGMSELFNEGKLSDPENDERYCAALAYLEVGQDRWRAHSHLERCNIIIDNLNSLRADMFKQPFVHITGTGLGTLSDILHQDEPVFTYAEEVYRTQNPKSITLHQELEEFGTLLALHQPK